MTVRRGFAYLVLMLDLLLGMVPLAIGVHALRKPLGLASPMEVFFLRFAIVGLVLNLLGFVIRKPWCIALGLLGIYGSLFVPAGISHSAQEALQVTIVYALCGAGLGGVLGYVLDANADKDGEAP